ncbi:hypothetical protein RHGRI_017660 [Rhododendron griersonianum]|uniref:Uncharacterized protein n=1 Tax=Rhododendron griersonianum TaxID=479676 RepID=A0AAV6JYM4_9ERIC|nr:hypothetical protein RHGRI_017660 [Rhododendron griersonianum]
MALFTVTSQLLEFCLKAPIYRWSCEELCFAMGTKGVTPLISGGYEAQPVGSFRRQWGFCVGEKLLSRGEWGSKGGRGGGGGATEVVVKEAENTSMNPP